MRLIKRLWRRIKWTLGAYGLWRQITQEDLHGGIIEITYANFGTPRRVEKYNLGPEVGDHEFQQLMAPLRPATPEWRHRLQYLSDYAPWTSSDLRREGIGR